MTEDCDADCRRADVSGGHVAIGLWHVAEIWIPTFIGIQLLYSIRWRIALWISDKLGGNKVESYNVEVD